MRPGDRGLRRSVLLGSQPYCDSFRTESDTRANSKGWVSTFLGEFMNDDPRNREEEASWVASPSRFSGARR